MDFKLWAEQYKLGYKDEKNKKHIIKYQGGEEESPTFENISKVLQKRGYLQQKEFINICKWKSSRPINHYRNNSEDEIEKKTSEVFKGNIDDRAKLKALLSLKGIRVPVASALLTVIYPQKYCIVDFRVWNTLLWLEDKQSLFKNYKKSFSGFIGYFRGYDGVDSYIFYLDKVTELAKKHNMIPREIEMALWKYDEKKGKRSN